MEYINFCLKYDVPTRDHLYHKVVTLVMSYPNFTCAPKSMIKGDCKVVKNLRI